MMVTDAITWSEGHTELCDHIDGQFGSDDTELKRVFRLVDRRHFVPEELDDSLAYADRPGCSSPLHVFIQTYILVNSLVRAFPLIVRKIF